LAHTHAHAHSLTHALALSLRGLTQAPHIVKGVILRRLQQIWRLHWLRPCLLIFGLLRLHCRKIKQATKVVSFLLRRLERRHHLRLLLRQWLHSSCRLLCGLHHSEGVIHDGLCGLCGMRGLLSWLGGKVHHSAEHVSLVRHLLCLRLLTGWSQFKTSEQIRVGLCLLLLWRLVQVKTTKHGGHLSGRLRLDSLVVLLLNSGSHGQTKHILLGLRLRLGCRLSETRETKIVSWRLLWLLHR
jgi:hypothetical protein